MPRAFVDKVIQRADSRVRIPKYSDEDGFWRCIVNELMGKMLFYKTKFVSLILGETFNC